MTRRDGGTTDRSRGSAGYESGYRFGQAWLLTEEGIQWRLGAGRKSPVPALRRLGNENGRDYLRGFYDAVMRRDGDRPAPSNRRRRVRPVTVSVTLTTEEYAMLKSFQAADGIATATRVRAMITAYAADAVFRQAVDAAVGP